MSEINFNDTTSPDYRAVLLAELGFGTKFISKKTNLSSGQVTYRTGQTGGQQRKGFRSGTSEMAQMLLDHIDKVITPKEQSVRADTYETLRDRALQKEADKRKQSSDEKRKALARVLRDKRKAKAREARG